MIISLIEVIIMIKGYKNKEWLEEQIRKYGSINVIARNTGYNRKTTVFIAIFTKMQWCIWTEEQEAISQFLREYSPPCE